MRISVIIPAYNVAAFLSETIESVLKQTYPVNEVIVVDDGSTDQTADIAESFGGPVHVLRQNNAGPSMARNRALDHASGDVIAFLDADDVWEPHKLERQIAYLAAHPEVGTVTSSFLRYRIGTHTQTVEMIDAKLLRFRSIDFLGAARVHTSTLVCRSGLARAIRFPIDIIDSEDLIYTAILRTQAPIGAVEEMLVKCREHPGRMSHTPNQFRRGVQARILWAKENYKLLGVASAEEAATTILHGAVQDVLGVYWGREIGKFKDRRRQLLEIWPQDESVPKDLQQILPPLFLFKLKDFFDTWWSTRRSKICT